LGGFSDQFPVTGNDVDLCCRARQQGLVTAITPHARLLHYESLSRGYAPDPAAELLAARYRLEELQDASCLAGSRR
jgi:GT2 family glycosyltransferase